MRDPFGSKYVDRWKGDIMYSYMQNTVVDYNGSTITCALHQSTIINDSMADYCNYGIYQMRTNYENLVCNKLSN